MTTSSMLISQFPYPQASEPCSREQSVSSCVQPRLKSGGGVLWCLLLDQPRAGVKAAGPCHVAQQQGASKASVPELSTH